MSTAVPLQEPRSSPRALGATEKATVHEVLNIEHFADLTPRQVYGTLLDEGEYYCSISTMYRIRVAVWLIWFLVMVAALCQSNTGMPTSSTSPTSLLLDVVVHDAMRSGALFS
jgi:hypothetical protein